MSKIFNPDSWNGPKEKKFEEISSKIATAICLIKSDLSYFFQLKESRPKMVIIQLFMIFVALDTYLFQYLEFVVAFFDRILYNFWFCLLELHCIKITITLVPIFGIITWKMESD